VGVARARCYRHQPHPARSLIQGERPGPPLALTAEEQQVVLAVIPPERLVDKAPSAVSATRLDAGISHGSLRTMDRLVAREDAVRERRHQRRQGHDRKPELWATGPNQVWSWAITQLKGPVKWSDDSR
jgi:putative transposase